MDSNSSKFERKPSLIGEISNYMENPAFYKLAELEGEYKPGEMSVQGWVMFKDKFAAPDAKGLDKVNVHLVCLDKDNNALFLRLPKKLGEELVEDFDASDETIDEYVKDIRKIRTYTTRFGTVGATYEVYE